MIKYAKIINNVTKLCEVGLGDAADYYKSLGMTTMEVEQAYNGSWYLEGYAPIKPEPSLEEQLSKLEKEYNMPRVIREGILANPSMYSQFNVLRAKELEELAKKIRDLKVGK